MPTRLCLSLAAAACAASLLPAAPAPDEPGVVIEAKKDVLEFRVGKETVTRYHFGESAAKPYFWPLTASNGVAVTRAWPMEKPDKGDSTDHPHQKSAWFCHGDVIPEGVELKQKVKGVEGVDFWSEAPGHGRIVCVSVGEPKNAKDHASVVTKNEWRTADGVKVMDETRTIALYALGESRLYVLDIDLHASVAAITFGDTKEGSMGVRVNDEIREAPSKKGEKGGHGTLTNADGKSGEKDVWGHQSKWCDYSGTLDGKVAGIAIFDDPANPLPAAWHSRGYGLMAANPFGTTKAGFPPFRGRKVEPVKLANGARLKLRYGILVHPGDVKEGKVREAFEKFTKLRE